MIRYDENVIKILLENLFIDNGYSYDYDVVNIYIEDEDICVHIIRNNFCYTFIYDIYNDDRTRVKLFCKVEGFIKSRREFWMREDAGISTLWLKRDFDEEALELCSQAQKLGNFSHYCYMVEECGGYYSAKVYINNDESFEFKRLVLADRLDLTIECLVIKRKYERLFTKEEIDICNSRLDKYSQSLNDTGARYYSEKAY